MGDCHLFSSKDSHVPQLVLVPTNLSMMPESPGGPRVPVTLQGEVRCGYQNDGATASRSQVSSVLWISLPVIRHYLLPTRAHLSFQQLCLPEVCGEQAFSCLYPEVSPLLVTFVFTSPFYSALPPATNSLLGKGNEVMGPAPVPRPAHWTLMEAEG